MYFYPAGYTYQLWPGKGKLTNNSSLARFSITATAVFPHCSWEEEGYHLPGVSVPLSCLPPILYKLPRDSGGKAPIGHLPYSGEPVILTAFLRDHCDPPLTDRNITSHLSHLLQVMWLV